MTQFIIIFFSSFVATSLSSMSGGGSSAITIPIMLSLGISFPLATSAQKLASAFWVFPASYNYLKDRKVNWKFLVLFSLIGLVGAYVGTLVVLAIPARTVSIVVGILILTLVAYVLLQKDIGLKETKVYSKLRKGMAYVFAPVLGFYETFFGSGNGMLFSIVTFKTRGFDFVDALGSYYAVAFLWDVLAFVVLFSNGYFSWSVMIPIIIGSFIGGYVGSKYAKYKGNKFIKVMFAIIGTILGIKLLFGF